MAKLRVVVALTASLLATAALAQLSQTYASWPKGPDGFLLTKQELKEYEKITTDAQAQAFIDLFWAKRDPDLNTVVNEFKLDFDQRVKAADKQFGTEKLRGALTDRGRTLLLLGLPSRHSSVPAGSPVQGSPGESSQPYEDRGNVEIWEYQKDRLPTDLKAEQVTFLFVESRLGMKDFPLERGDRRNAMAMKLLASAPERWLLNPKLTEVPKLGLLPGSKAPNSAQLAVLATEPRPWPEGTRTYTTTGIATVSLHLAWASVRLPASAPVANEAIGRVRAGAGDAVAGTFVVAVTPLDAGGEKLYEFALPIDAGAWKLDLALLAAGAPVAVGTIDLETEQVPADGAYLSPFYWGVDIRQEAQAHLGDPFNVGGWHVVMHPEEKYASGESISYFCFVLRPGLNEAGEPKITVGLAVYMDERKLTERAAEQAQLSQVSEDLWMYGSQLPLSVFRRSGSYRREVILTDTASGVTRTGKIPITIEVPAPAGGAATP
jgi:GWxTD domain-containing protein